MTEWQLARVKAFALENDSDLLHTEVDHLDDGSLEVRVYRKDSPIETSKTEDLVAAKRIR
jgi:hypothetical protein